MRQRSQVGRQLAVRHQRRGVGEAQGVVVAKGIDSSAGVPRCWLLSDFVSG
jgi:hypothetical protein